MDKKLVLEIKEEKLEKLIQHILKAEMFMRTGHLDDASIELTYVYDGLNATLMRAKPQT